MKVKDVAFSKKCIPAPIKKLDDDLKDIDLDRLCSQRQAAHLNA